LATHTYASLDLSEAKRLADLTGLKHDLQKAKEYAARFIVEFEKPKYDSVLVETLSIAMLIQYNRAFTSGVREQGLLDVNILSEQQKELHERLRFWRDKHIAHSVNAFEESQPVARFCLERIYDEGVYGIECNHGRVIAPSLDEANSMIELSEFFSKFVEAEIVEEKKKLLALARKIPIEDLLNPDRHRAMLVSGEPIDKPRKKIF
jgi:hypothetical protein